MYIDESGDTATPQQGGSRFLALTGCVVHEGDKVALETEFRAIKERFYANPDIEIKSNFLRYANPDIPSKHSPIKLHDRNRYDELERALADFLQASRVTLIAVAIDKRGFWERHPAKNPYDAAYTALLQGFQSFLAEQDSVGLCIIDPREGKVEKRFMDAELDRTHHALRWSGSEFGARCPNIIERVLFSSSDLTVGIQIADLYCYPILHVFEYDKTGPEYWRFQEVTRPKFYRGALRFLPEDTKKDFRFYAA